MKINRTKTVSVLLCLIWIYLCLASTTLAKDPPTYEAFGYYNGRNYNTEVYKEDFNGVKEWTSTQPFPITFEEVIKIASHAITPIASASHLEVCEVAYTKMTIINKWFFVVSFGYSDKAKQIEEATIGKPTVLYVVVMPNQKVIIPAPQ